ncbi:class I SAM-dependent methyltransferase [Burkholderia gladioli]|uniref:class I SAM-dependent methyltransferase n=1 Tax=Burkholderia gladioli TaxID=28095 RepID=UPI0016409E2C|nr:class I SAM-dependent methyltransferase [Burkholderia gladioli]
MNNWNVGSVDEVAYTFGYCDELNPLRLKLPLLQAGFAVPVVETACELGFGYGVSVNIHAAGSTTRWHGTDFNAAHAGFAQRLAQHAGSQASLSGESFSTFCLRDDLPDFDFIGMHGIWSWVSEENRGLIGEFIARKLKPGGVLYLSYNTQPGWTPMLPVRELLYRHFHFNAAADAVKAREAVPTEQAIAMRVKAAIDFVRGVFATQPGYAVVNPLLAERVEALSRADPRYLAHEYFNRDWRAMLFQEVHASLADAGLTYAGSADYRDRAEEIHLDAAQRAMLAQIADIGLRETVRDVCLNRSLRRDYWIKAPRRLDDAARDAALRAHRVVLALPRASVILKVRGTLGEAALPEALYGPILDVLADHQPTALGKIEQALRARAITLERIVKAVTLLIGTGALVNAQDDEQIDRARAGAERLNVAICEAARTSDEVGFLASPVAGSGVLMPRVAQLFLLARRQDKPDPVQWAEFAEGVLNVAAPPGDTAVSLAERVAQARRFAELHLPVLQALGIG